MGPTHEEVITDIARNFLQSYRQLPVTLYQIQTKFRDEVRPRFGLMRGREFLMKDAYSFHETSEGSLKEYQNMYQAYVRIFSRCGLAFRSVEADTGNIGGSTSHEFHVLAKSGEDEILSCDQCQYSANSNLIQKKQDDVCIKCKKGKFQSYRGIEVGHIFYLGNKYSQSMKASFLNEEGKSVYFEMGCYGIGVGRTAAAAIEQNNDKDGIVWPISLAPFQVALVPLDISDSKVKTVTHALYEGLKKENIEVLEHDKDERAGVKFKDIDLIGIPIRVTLGMRGLAQNKVGIKLRNEKEEKMVDVDQALHNIIETRNELFRKINPST